MSHIDEGLLHARLDGALAPDDPEWQAAGRHLEACADCRRRFERARELRGDAAEILAASSLPSPARPAFADLVAAASARRDVAPPASTTGRVGSRWWRSPVKLAWAASLVLAVGAGWMGRALIDTGGGSPPAVQLADEAEAARGDQARARGTEAAEATEATEGEASPERNAVQDESIDARAAAPSELAARAAKTRPEPVTEEAFARGEEDRQVAGDVAAGCYVAETAGQPIELRVDGDGTARFRGESGLYVGFWQRGDGGGTTLELTDRTSWIRLVLEPTAAGLRGTLEPGKLDVNLSFRSVACPPD